MTVIGIKQLDNIVCKIWFYFKILHLSQIWLFLHNIKYWYWEKWHVYVYKYYESEVNEKQTYELIEQNAKIWHTSDILVYKCIL